MPFCDCAKVVMQRMVDSQVMESFWNKYAMRQVYGYCCYVEGRGRHFFTQSLSGLRAVRPRHTSRQLIVTAFCFIDARNVGEYYENV